MAFFRHFCVVYIPFVKSFSETYIPLVFYLYVLTNVTKAMGCGSSKTDKAVEFSDKNGTHKDSAHDPRDRSQLKNRHAFVHYTPYVGPIFRNLKVDSDFSPYPEYHLQLSPIDRTGPKVLSRLRDSRAEFGETVTLRCEIHGNPRPNIKWYKDNQVISPSLKYWSHYDGQMAELTVHLCSRIDGGYYKCEADNMFGKRETAAHLYIDLKDSRPGKLVPKAKTVYEYSAAKKRDKMYLTTYYFTSYPMPGYPEVRRRQRLRKHFLYCDLF